MLIFLLMATLGSVYLFTSLSVILANQNASFATFTNIYTNTFFYEQRARDICTANTCTHHSPPASRSNRSRRAFFAWAHLSVTSTLYGMLHQPFMSIVMVHFSDRSRHRRAMPAGGRAGDARLPRRRGSCLAAARRRGGPRRGAHKSHPPPPHHTPQSW